MSDVRPLNKRQLQAVETRERVLQAAKEVFAAHGYRATTVGAITKAAETAHGTFYLYFKNKDDALIDIVEAVGEELLASLGAAYSDDPWTMCRESLLAFLQVFQAHGGLWTTLLEGSFQSPAVYATWARSRRLYIESIAVGIQRQCEASQTGPIDARQAAVALGSMAEWYAFTYLVLGSLNDDGETAEEAVDTLATVWYRAIYGRTDRD